MVHKCVGHIRTPLCRKRYLQMVLKRIRQAASLMHNTVRTSMVTLITPNAEDNSDRLTSAEGNGGERGEAMSACETDGLSYRSNSISRTPASPFALQCMRYARDN